MILKESFLHSLQDCAGFSSASFVQSHQLSPVTSLRINKGKVDVTEEDTFQIWNSSIFNKIDTNDKVPWCDTGYYLKERPVFTLDPLIHAGAYYVQEASSMFIEHVVSAVMKNQSGLNALDLCAAPGGKTTLLSSLPNFKLILSNEIIQSRISVLFENAVKWGIPNVFISNRDPKEIGKLSGFFDLIMVDAPCSGSGLFRKDLTAMDQWNEDLVTFCSKRQQRILEDALPALKQDGILIYSTCSFSTEENEKQIDYLLSNFDLESIRIPIKSEWGIIEAQSEVRKGWGYRFYPDRVKGEGFFCAAFKKTDSATTLNQTKQRRQTIPVSNFECYFQHPERLTICEKEKEFFAIPTDAFDDFLLLSENISLKKSGVRLGSFIKNELIPDHELAMMTDLSHEIESVHVDHLNALKFLKKESFSIDNLSKGWHLVKYCGVSLGWVKSIPGRLNNYYPKNWRIMMNF